MSFKNFLFKCGTHISHVQHILFISSESPFHTLITQVYDISSIHHYFIFLGLQRSIVKILHISKNHKKKKDKQKKIFFTCALHN